MDEGENEGEKPPWWRRNEALREEMDLPAYEPSRFRDGVYTHEIVPKLEADHDATIRFVGFGDRSGDWEVRADGEALFSVGRRRDENANTVYEIDAGTFERRVEAGLDPDHSDHHDDSA
jgi:hypothetical protein